jgi:hypothetical protein
MIIDGGVEDITYMMPVSSWMVDQIEATSTNLGHGAARRMISEENDRDLKFHRSRCINSSVDGVVATIWLCSPQNPAALRQSAVANHFHRYVVEPDVDIYTVVIAS